MNDQFDQGLTCVDPKVGEHILDLTLPKSTGHGSEHELLLAHAEVCAFCRLTLDLHHHLGEGIRDGSLADVPVRVLHPSRRHQWTGWAAVTAVAASLICILILPPRPVGPSLVLRGANDTRILRPVEGEVVGDGDLEVVWTGVPGADAYRVGLSGGRDGFTWSEETSETHLIIPADTKLAQGETFRIILSTVPADLLPPGGVSVSIQTGNRYAVASHRVRRAQPVVFGLGLASLVFTLLFAFSRRPRLLRKEYNNFP